MHNDIDLWEVVLVKRLIGFTNHLEEADHTSGSARVCWLLLSILRVYSWLDILHQLALSFKSAESCYHGYYVSIRSSCLHQQEQKCFSS